MNKLIIKACLVLGIGAGVTSCTDNYLEYNTNPAEPTYDQMQADGKLVATAMRGMQSNIIPSQEHLYQFVEALIGGTYGGYMADSNPWNYSFIMYNPTQDWLKRPLTGDCVVSNVYSNYSQLKKVTDDALVLAIGDVVRISAMVRLADMYGPIPYSKVGSNGSSATPYDSQKDAYMRMFDELNVAIEALTAQRTSTISPKVDRIFGGKIEKWVKFANSLKLRMAMRIVYAEPAIAQQHAESAVNHEVGPMADNSDIAYLELNSKHPLVLIMNEWGDTRVAADITSYMNGYNDPRRAKYFITSTFSNVANGFIGMRRGYQAPDKNEGMQYSNINMAADNNKLLVMNAAETAFLKAEGALRGWNMGGTAQEFYEQGIRLSFEQWGVGNAANYIADQTSMPEAYIDPLGKNSDDGKASTIKIAWDQSADEEANLERIITQKWIANFPLGIEAWAEYRRTGYPYLMKSPDNRSGGIVDDRMGTRRLPYPQQAYAENEFMPDAVKMLNGADNMATRTWWDCKNLNN